MPALANTLACRFCTIRRIRNVVVLATVIVVLTMYFIVTRTTPTKPNKNINKNGINGHRELINYSPKQGTPLKISLSLSTVAVVGTDVSFSKLKDFKENFNYLLVIPRASNQVNSLMNTNTINSADKQKTVRLLRILEKRRAYDGATCMGTSNEPPIHTSCHFESRNWTLLIGKSTTRSHKSDVIECNIIEHAFVIRRKVFETLYFNPQYGETTLLDFYLRSKGKLKIAGFSDCSFSADLNRRDRGGLVSSSFFTDYIYLGSYHRIARIVRENEITWTKCSYQNRLCPEKLLNNVNITSSRKLLPVCCSEVLDKLLVDVVQALKTMGLDYRIEYGTLLGAVRSGTIIPWTRDVDIGLKEDDYFHKKYFSNLEELLRPKHYALPVFKGQRRVIPLFPPTRAFTGSPFDPSFQKRLFSRRVLNVMKRLANTKTRWRDLGYLDFYVVKKEHFDSHATVQINGRSYSTFVDMKEKLKDWYGPKYMDPSKKQSAPIEVSISKRRKQREKKQRKRRGKRSAKKKKKRNKKKSS